MLLKEISDKFGGLGVFEKRRINDEYIEVVFFNKDIESWNKIISESLGSAVKPAGVKPSKSDLMVTEQFGGIHKNQTLFKKEFDDKIIVGMYWPWTDTIHTTLKIVFLEKQI